jgi:hypothetical protein
MDCQERITVIVSSREHGFELAVIDFRFDVSHLSFKLESQLLVVEPGQLQSIVQSSEE